MRRHTLASIALLAASAAASAAPPPADAPAPAADAGSREVCFVEARTGSNIKQKVCMTEAERERRRKEDQEAMSKLRNSSTGAGARNTGVER